ncbi:MAG: hypothetical protein M0T85_15475 [Dehalococcoidales bacterium]|nr:hypothetical protein [Dehalococcoidales bacterium]
MRYTVIDKWGAVSFVADCHALAALVAGCAEGAEDLDELLEFAERYDQRLREYVTCGLAVFDEHNADGNHTSIHEALAYCAPHEIPVFRVVDDETRQASLQSVKAGIIIFNLTDRRIVQIQNTYSEIRRKGKVRMHDGTRLTNKMYPYELPPDWSVVPGK